MTNPVLDHVLSSVNDAQVNSTELAIFLFDVAATLHTSATELRRIAIEVTTFSNVLPHLEATLQLQRTARPTEHLIHALVTVLRNANNVLHSIEEAVASAKAETIEVGPADHVDSVRPLMKSAQMTVYRLSLEALRLSLVLIDTIVVWSGHFPERDAGKIASAKQDEACAKCAVLSLRASLMQLQLVEKISSNETAARRLSEERKHAADMLHRIDRKADRRHSSQPRHHKEEKSTDPVSVLLEELIFAPVSSNLHSTHSWIAQSTEHSLLLRDWTGIDVDPVPDSLISVSTTVITPPAPTADPHTSRKVSLFGKVTKIRSSSASHGAKDDRGRLLSVQ